ncbi:MAG: allophanate hydrolase, partial [Salinibacterium sp.]|nr:allophanate hydrolase [Salinibacterium sp.]
MTTLRVIEPGMFTTVQDLGRGGVAAVGVPPSGVADAVSLTVGNRLLGNADGAAALECTLTGPSLTFDGEAVVCLTGAECPNARIAGTKGERPLGWCEPTPVGAGELIKIGAMEGRARAYLCVGGGIGVPIVLGSRSTLVGASLGGHHGRPLRKGDTVSLLSGGK